MCDLHETLEALWYLRECGKKLHSGTKTFGEVIEKAESIRKYLLSRAPAAEVLEVALEDKFMLDGIMPYTTPE